MSLASLIPNDSQPSPAQRAAATIDASLGKLQHGAAAAVRALDDRRLYHAEADLRAAIWHDMSAEQADALGAIEPLLRQWAEPALLTIDAEALAVADQQVTAEREVAGMVGPVIGALTATQRTTARGGEVPGTLAVLAPLVAPLLAHSVRDLAADAATVRQAIGRVLGEALAVNVEAVAIGRRVGWSHVEPLLEHGNWWTQLRTFIAEHLAERDPGQPQAEPAPVTDGGE